MNAVRLRYGLLLLAVAGFLISALFAGAARGAGLDELSLDRWKLLREAERYQLNIAEKYYREQNWKVALKEYEKFLELYEQSEGSPFAQLKWSMCQVQLRKINTAVKDGYQTIIDYWPDSPEAMSSAYLIGKAYKEMGETKKAKQAYADVLAKHNKQLVAVYARMDLIDIARVEGDVNRRVTLWRELTYDTERNANSAPTCAEASRQLAVHYFTTGAFLEGEKALATTYTPEQLPYQVLYYAQGPITQLMNAPETKAQGEKVAEAGAAWLQSIMPTTLTDPAQKKVARQLWFYVADFYAVGRLVNKVPEAYDQMGKIFGVDDEMLGRLAAWHKTQNQRDEARKIYGRFENKAEGQGQIALSYREEQKWDQAIATYRTVSLQDPQRMPPWKSELAYTYRLAGKCDECVAAYRELLTEDSKNANSYQWAIAIAYRDFGRHKEAIQNFRQCENFVEAYQQMAWCHRALKEWKEAIGFYGQIMATSEPNAPWALTQIGYTHEQAGNKEQAIKVLQNVCKKYPKHAQASEAHAYLQDKFKIQVTLGGTNED